MALAVLVKGPWPADSGHGWLGVPVVFREVRAGLRRLFPWEGRRCFSLSPRRGMFWRFPANGWAFIEGFVIKHHLTRYYRASSPARRTVLVLCDRGAGGFFPWSGFLPPHSGARAGRPRRRRPATAGDPPSGDVPSAGSRPLRLLPRWPEPSCQSISSSAVPAMALLVGKRSLNVK